MRSRPFVIAAASAALALGACLEKGYGEPDEAVDAGRDDAGALDGGMPDAGVEDAGGSDAGDGGVPDAGCGLNPDPGAGAPIVVVAQKLMPATEGTDEYSVTYSRGLNRICVQQFGSGQIACADGSDDSGVTFNPFSPQQHITANLPMGTIAAHPELTTDGGQLYFSVVEQGVSQQIYMARAHANGYGFEGITLVTIDQAPSRRMMPSLTADGTELFFAAHEGDAPLELYVAKHINDVTFGSTVKLSSIEGPHAAFNPAISPEGDLLIYETLFLDANGVLDAGQMYSARTCSGFSPPKLLPIAYPAPDDACCLGPEGVDFIDRDTIYSSHTDSTATYSFDVFRSTVTWPWPPPP